MPPLPAKSSDDILSGATSTPPHHYRAKSARESQCEDARVIFNKTIEGHYRQGKTGYRQVGALFLTWADDDMQCKATEVSEHNSSHIAHELRLLYAFRSPNWEISSMTGFILTRHSTRSPPIAGRRLCIKDLRISATNMIAQKLSRLYTMAGMRMRARRQSSSSLQRGWTPTHSSLYGLCASTAPKLLDNDADLWTVKKVWE